MDRSSRRSENTTGTGTLLIRKEDSSAEEKRFDLKRRGKSAAGRRRLATDVGDGRGVESR